MARARNTLHHYYYTNFTFASSLAKPIQLSYGVHLVLKDG